MQNHKAYSLNAIRVFNVVARAGSILTAAGNLSLTPGAVSHQIKKLEQELEITLFERGNNSITLTNPGKELFEVSDLTLARLDKAVGNLKGNENEINIRCQISLAVRWLIPALEELRQIYPEYRVSVETRWDSTSHISERNDFAIFFIPVTQKQKQGKLLYKDFSRPVASPNYLKSVKYDHSANIAELKLIGAASRDWDWKMWCEQHELSFEDLDINLRTDTDDAAIHAAIAGMGVTLAPEIMTRSEIKSGSLVELPNLNFVELGGYYLLSNSIDTRARRRVSNWLMQQMEK